MTFLNGTLKLPLSFPPMIEKTSLAIQAALSNNWDKAIEINKSILKENPEDINSMNRLAFALIQMQKIDEAKKIYKKILIIDKYNSIAQKNLDKISSLSKNKKKAFAKNKICTLSPSLFIEEPGKTKTVTLTNIAPSAVLININIGDEVTLNPKKHSLEVRSCNKVYLGALPDDIAFRLLRLIKATNSYQVNVKNISKNSISVFIRELKRGKRFATQPSFITLLTDRSHIYSLHQEKISGEEEDEDKPPEADLDE